MRVSAARRPGRAGLRQHLAEIREFSAGVNRHGGSRRWPSSWPATVSRRPISPRTTSPRSNGRCPPMAVYEALREKFHEAVPPEFRQDDLDNLEWRNRMYAALIGEDEKTISEESLLGLEFRVLHADRMAARRADRGRGVDLRLRSSNWPRRPASRDCGGCATRNAAASSSISSANTATWSTSTSAGWSASLSQPGQVARPPRRLHRPSQAAAASRRKSSRSSACRNGASANTSTTASGCWTPSSSRKNTPNTSSTAALAAGNWA